MAKAKKLKSGNWRVLIFDYTDENGKRHYKSFTAATKKEAEYEASLYKLSEKSVVDGNITVKQALLRYCDIKSNVLSPVTLLEYKRLVRSKYKSIENISLSKLKKEQIQIWINEYALEHSPKSVRNVYGLLSAALRVYSSKMINDIALPQKIKPDLYVPTDKDVQILLKYFSEKSDVDMEVAVYLAAFGTLRRSEVCALTSSDIRGNIIYITKAKVAAEGGKWVDKTTKTVSSTRSIEMPDYIINKLPKRGKVVNLNPKQLSTRFSNALDDLGLYHFRFHDLRHYAASVMHALGVPDQYIMERGGWSSDGTLKRIYRNVMIDYKAKFTNKMIQHFEHMQEEINN
jgi:integrase family protein